MKKPKKESPLLDELRKNYGMRSDAHLAEALEVSKVTIHDIRHGLRPVSGDMRCIIMRKFGMTLKQVDKLAPPVKEKA